MFGLELLSLLLVLGGCVAGYFWYDAMQRRVCLERLDSRRASVPSAVEIDASQRDRFPPRFYWIPVIIVLAVAAFSYFAFGLPAPFVLAVTAIIGMIAF